MTKLSFDNLLAKAEEFEVAQKKLRADMAAMIKPLLMDFLAENPKVKSIRWFQYTPYFNDGGTCEFSVHDVYFSTVKTPKDWDESEKVFQTYRYNEASGVDKATYENCDALDNALHKCEDALQELFGDHVEVIVTREGVETEEYDHD